MKITRIVVTATMVLSLQSALFCSEKPKLERKDSFDVTQKGNGPKQVLTEFSTSGICWLGYTPQNCLDYTLDHCGQLYHNDTCEIRPASSPAAIAYWNHFVEQSPENAERFIDAYNKVKYREGDISAHPSYKLAATIVMQDLNNQSKKLIAQHYHDNQARLLSSTEENQQNKKLSDTLKLNFDKITKLENAIGQSCANKFQADRKKIKPSNINYLACQYQNQTSDTADQNS